MTASSGTPVNRYRRFKGLDRNGRVIYVGAFSKSLSPALRVSYMVLPTELLEGYKEKLGFCICPVPTIQQKALQRFMDEGHFERHLNRMRIIYRQKRGGHRHGDPRATAWRQDRWHRRRAASGHEGQQRHERD